MKDLKKLMTVGTFGITKNGNKFVVINDGVVVYHSGGWDMIDSLMTDPDYDEVAVLISGCHCFNSVDYLSRERKHIIYDSRNDVCMTIPEIEEKLGVKNLKIELSKEEV